ncbi:MAG: hypothetical protein JOZ80_16435, partial [Acidobacteriaceae bacterium]|nr:hypothetical protein [Acidobacteriaceae bacterium]
IDFDVLVQRNATYRAAEQKSFQDFQRDRESLLAKVHAEQQAECALQGGAR